jgi:hypothetical protein
MSNRFNWNGMNTGAAPPRAEAPAPAPAPSPSDEGPADLYEEKAVHITFAKIAKWGAVFLGLFGAGYVLRGLADSATGATGLLEALRSPRKKDDGDISGLGIVHAMWPGHGTNLSRPPSPEELAYWSTYYKRGAAAVGELPAAALPEVPRVVREPLPPPSRQETAAERALLAPSRPKTPRYAWGGGYSGMSGGYGGGYGGGYIEDHALPMGDDEFTIVKEG